MLQNDVLGLGHWLVLGGKGLIRSGHELHEHEDQQVNGLPIRLLQFRDPREQANQILIVQASQRMDVSIYFWEDR